MKVRYLILSVIITISTALYFKTKASVNIANVQDYGAKGDGRHDDSAAFQRATNTGKIVYIPKGIYCIPHVIRYTGTVHWKGSGKQSIILTDNVAIEVRKGTNSIIENLCLKNRTAPMLIRRNSILPYKPPVVSTSIGNGYQPTVNDGEVWNNLSPVFKNQNIGPSIVFSGNAMNITIDRIYGNFVSLLLNDAQKSIVKNCDFRAGKNVFGGVVFVNLNNRGIGNTALNNHISYASYNGIVFIGNSSGVIQNNRCENNGESGIKLYQNEIGQADARCFKMIIKGNLCQYNFYDGFDLQANYPRDGLAQTFHIVYNNKSQYNYKTGFIVDGVGMKFVNNYAGHNWGSGVNAYNNQSTFENNVFSDNNLSNETTGVHQFVLTYGSNNYITKNKFTFDKVSKGYSIYDATGNNIIEGNIAQNGSIFVAKKSAD